MDVLLVVVIAVFVVFVIIALVFIIKLFRSQNSSSEIHISGGANIDRGYLSNDSNYFKGGYSGLDETMVVGVNHRSNIARTSEVKLTNLRTMQVYTLNVDVPVVIGRVYSPGGLAIGGDASLSKQHCRLYSYQGEVFVEDVGSSNGTQVNTIKLRAPYRLNNGDVIKVGKTEFKFEI